MCEFLASFKCMHKPNHAHFLVKTNWSQYHVTYSRTYRHREMSNMDALVSIWDRKLALNLERCICTWIYLGTSYYNLSSKNFQFPKLDDKSWLNITSTLLCWPFLTELSLSVRHFVEVARKYNMKHRKAASRSEWVKTFIKTFWLATKINLYSAKNSYSVMRRLKREWHYIATFWLVTKIIFMQREKRGSVMRMLKLMT